MFDHSDTKVTNIENWYRELESRCHWFVGRSEGVCIENLEDCKQNLMGDSGGNSEDQNVDRNVDSKGCAPNVLCQNGDSTGSWTQSHSYHILAKILSIPHPCLRL